MQFCIFLCAYMFLSNKTSACENHLWARNDVIRFVEPMHCVQFIGVVASTELKKMLIDASNVNVNNK